jgi:4-amino-4-deoxy-L-arabinose transferase-like glycosyltransferase
VSPRLPARSLGGVAGWVAVAALGLGLILPGLGRFGLWDPWEVRVAEEAAAVAAGGPVESPGPRVLLAALGLRLFGPGEGSARLPGALAAVATLLALAWAASAHGRRVALAAPLVLLATPLFLLQARQLTSDIPLLLGSALALGGLSHLCAGPGPRGRLVALGLAALGLVLAGVTGGALVGVVPPCLAFGAAWLLSGGRQFPRSLRILGAAALLIGLTFAALALLTPYRAGEHAWLLGGRPIFGPSGRSFEGAFRVLGFGLFPWSALALFVVMVPLGELEHDPPAGERSRRLGTLIPVFWAVFGIAGATLQLHLVGQARLSVLPAVALLLARWLAEPAGPTNRVLGLVVAIGTVLVARDLWHTPAELLSVHLPATIEWPPGLPLRVAFASLGGLCALALLARFACPPAPAGPGRWERLGSWAHRAAPAILLSATILFSATLAHAVVPMLSRHLSQKRLYDTFRVLGGPSRTLALYRVSPSGGGPFPQPDARIVEVGSAADLAARFRADGSLFALIPRGELAPVDDAFAEAASPYAVADVSSSRFLLLAGRLPPGLPDQNPLAELRFRPGLHQKPPWEAPRVPVSARFGEVVELYGADFPRSVRRPGSFPLVLHFRTLQRPPAGYKIFVHVERGGALVHGDHAPLAGTFPTERWRPGDHIRDRHLVPVPLVTAPAGVYTIHVGFWPGGNTVRRLPVTAGAHDGRNRVALGTIRFD